MKLSPRLPAELTRKFDIFDWRNGLAILRSVHETELAEVVEVLTRFQLPWSQLAEKGKNKTETENSE